MNVQLTYDLDANAVPREHELRRMLDTLSDAFATPSTFTGQVSQTRHDADRQRAERKGTPWLRVQLTYQLRHELAAVGDITAMHALIADAYAASDIDFRMWAQSPADELVLGELVLNEQGAEAHA